MNDSLINRVAVVTGGGGGIGSASAKILASYGANVVVADVNIDAAKAVATEICNDGGVAVGMAVNLMSKDSVEELMACAEAQYGSIDILINAAGILSGVSIPEISVEQWDTMLDINLRGVHFSMQAVLPYMKKRNSGAIVSVTSQAGQVGGWLSSVAYSASKGGMLAITKAYARHAGPFGIRVNDVAPGLIATDMTAKRGDKPEGIPVGRLGTAQDVANAVYFLASDLSSFITGTTIDVNGGQFMRS